MSNETNIDVDQLLSVLEDQRVALIEKDRVINGYESQLTQANKTMMDLIQLNFELKEEILALKVENESIIEDLKMVETEREKMYPVANVGEKVLGLFSELSEVIELKKHQEYTERKNQENGGM